jgi:hypothetical protein
VPVYPLVAAPPVRRLQIASASADIGASANVFTIAAAPPGWPTRPDANHDAPIAGPVVHHHLGQPPTKGDGSTHSAVVRCGRDVRGSGRQVAF